MASDQACPMNREAVTDKLVDLRGLNSSTHYFFGNSGEDTILYYLEKLLPQNTEVCKTDTGVLLSHICPGHIEVGAKVSSLKIKSSLDEECGK